MTESASLSIILKLRTDADTTIGVQEKKTADMHEKYRQKMICRESVNVVGNETLLQQAVTVRK